MRRLKAPSIGLLAGFVMLAASWPGHAVEITDTTGRVVSIPDHVRSVRPAGVPAAVLIAAVAPDLLMGWPTRVPAGAEAWLPAQLATRPALPSLIDASVLDNKTDPRPDLIVDYGNTGERYVEQAIRIQDGTGVPTILLDGRIAYAPLALRVLGRALGREARAEELARFVEGILASAAPHRDDIRLVIVHGPNGSEVAIPRSAAAEAPEFLGWMVVAPPAPDGEVPGTAFRPASVAQIAALDPDVVIFTDPAMRARVTSSPEWAGVRAIRDHRAWFAPVEPFGWIDQPNSLNRLLGVAWLGQGSPSEGVLPLAAAFHAVVYGRTPTPSQTAALRAQLQPLEPFR